MRAHFISTKFKRWLQTHPEDARQQRLQMQQTAQRFLQEGDEHSAIHCSGQAYEIAHAVVLSLSEPEGETEQVSQDFIAYGALAIFLADHYRQANEAQAARQVIDQTYQQLQALLPLYVQQPQLSRLIQAIAASLNDAAGATGGDDRVLH